MLLGFILGCEIAFWLFVLAGLVARYGLQRPRASTVLLVCAPVVDLMLLIATILDLRGGHEATVYDALAGVYIGVSVGFGQEMIRWADERFAHRFAGAPSPAPKPRYGKAHAARERHLWLRHVLAWAVGCAFLGAVVLVIGDADRTNALLRTAQLWTLVLAVDGAISLSYTVHPRRGR